MPQNMSTLNGLNGTLKDIENALLRRKADAALAALEVAVGVEDDDADDDDADDADDDDDGADDDE